MLHSNQQMHYHANLSGVMACTGVTDMSLSLRTSVKT